jgi:hypothetical protein
MVRRARFVLRARPGGQQAQVPVKLKGVGIDDLAVNAFSEL